MNSDQNNNPRRRLMARLFAEAAKRGIAQDDLRNVITPGVIGKRLSKASAMELDIVIRHIGAASQTHPHPAPLPEGEGEKKRMSGFKERFDELGRREGMATPSQLRHIEGLWMQVSKMPHRTAKEKALQGFLKRIVGVDDLRFVESWMVHKIVRAMQSMRRG